MCTKSIAQTEITRSKNRNNLLENQNHIDPPPQSVLEKPSKTEQEICLPKSQNQSNKNQKLLSINQELK